MKEQIKIVELTSCHMCIYKAAFTCQHHQVQNKFKPKDRETPTDGFPKWCPLPSALFNTEEIRKSCTNCLLFKNCEIINNYILNKYDSAKGIQKFYCSEWSIFPDQKQEQVCPECGEEWK